MLVTLTADRSAALADATDLGYLLHKHPDRVQHFPVHGGVAHVFYPEATTERCTAALLVEVDPAALVTGRSLTRDGAPLSQYVNDRPYVASSLVSVALGKVFGSALGGRCAAREDLVGRPLDLTVSLPAVPGDPELVERLFTPMGWAVSATAIAVDDTRPEWGDAPLVSLVLRGTMPLADALSHLYVLLPVLDDGKHYWVGDDEVDKLIRAGAGWLGAHPDRALITDRYLAHQRVLTRSASARLEESAPAPEEAPVRPRPLVGLRHDAVLDVVRDLRPSTVVDLGCGSGALLGSLLGIQGVDRVVGTEVSDGALSAAARRLHVDTMTERQSARLSLLLSSLQYEDERLRGMDVAVLMEVIEHIDPSRLPAIVSTVFGYMHPKHVVVTTPNVEYNVHYPGLADGGFRHPDHRFEWDRATFEAWSRSVGDRHGYDVRFRTVGEVDEEVGSPTQMAVFSAQDGASS